MAAYGLWHGGCLILVGLFQVNYTTWIALSLTILLILVAAPFKTMLLARMRVMLWEMLFLKIRRNLILRPHRTISP